MTTILVAVVVLAAALAAVLVVVPYGQRCVVLRSGKVRRVAGTGLVWRLPIAERAVRVVSGPVELPVRARATTVDGVPVLVLAEARVRLLPPQVGDRWTDPWPEVDVLGERGLAALISTLPVAQLRYALRSAENRLRERLTDAVGPLGVEVQAVEVLEVELPLAGEAWTRLT